MTLKNPLWQPQPKDGVILSKAFLRAGEILGLTQKEMAHVIGKSEPTISRLANRSLTLEPQNKEGEIALVFLRLYRSLDALYGGRQSDIRAWFTSANRELSGVPRELIRSLEGLFHVVNYLDAMRAKI